VPQARGFRQAQQIVGQIDSREVRIAVLQFQAQVRQIEGICLVRRVDVKDLGSHGLQWIVRALVSRGFAPAFQTIGQRLANLVLVGVTDGANGDIARAVEVLLEVPHLFDVDRLDSLYAYFKAGRAADIVFGPWVGVALHR